MKMRGGVMQEILVVDDEPHIREVVRYALEREGYAVREASDGLQAMQEVRRRPPALVVLDVVMPELDGIEVCRRIQASQRVPIVFLWRLAAAAPPPPPPAPAAAAAASEAAGGAATAATPAAGAAAAATAVKAAKETVETEESAEAAAVTPAVSSTRNVAAQVQ